MDYKYDSTEFWYTFINSLYNQGLSSNSGISEIDEETQEKLLNYFKEKIEEGITNGETTLPPGLHDYLWRLPKEMLPKTRSLTDSFLQSDPKNPAAALLRTITEISDWDTKNDPHIDETFSLIPKDPCMNLVVIDEFRKLHGFPWNIDGLEKVLISLENLYTWAVNQDDTARYQEARSFYYDHRITPYTVYKDIKGELQYFKQILVKSGHPKGNMSEIDRLKPLIKRCRDLVPMENAAFRKNIGQQSAEQQDLIDPTSDSPDIWGAYLKSLENRKNAPPRRLTQKDQEYLLEYLKTKITNGVVEGKTTLPAQLQKHISDFPEPMHLELREFVEEVLEAQPENGAAMKMLAIIVWEGKRTYHGKSDQDLTLLEQAMVLIPNDAESCYYAVGKYENNLDPIFNLTITALERMFERSKQQGESELYRWLTELYKEVDRTPCYTYRALMKNSEANIQLISRCKPLITEMQHVFHQKLAHDPDDWFALRGLSDTYETLGDTESAQRIPWEPNQKFTWKQKVWVGKQLPDFSAKTLDGTLVTLSDYRGKMLVLNFCAKWCGFCAPEIPYLKDVYEQHHETGLEVIGVSLDENETDLTEFTEEHKIPWLQIYDGKGWKSELAQLFGIDSVPSQWLIDRDGKILSVSSRGEQLGQLVKWTEAARIGNMIPDFTAVDVDGNSITTAAIQGKVVILYFGYIYEDPELQLMDALYHKYHKNGFDIICMNIGGIKDEESLRVVVRTDNHQGHYIYAAHDGQQATLGEQFGFSWTGRTNKVELPAFILIDTKGKVIDARSGKVHSPEIWAERLEKLMITHLGL